MACSCSEAPGSGDSPGPENPKGDARWSGPPGTGRPPTPSGEESPGTGRPPTPSGEERLRCPEKERGPRQLRPVEAVMSSWYRVWEEKEPPRGWRRSSWVDRLCRPSPSWTNSQVGKDHSREEKRWGCRHTSPEKSEANRDDGTYLCERGVKNYRTSWPLVPPTCSSLLACG